MDCRPPGWEQQAVAARDSKRNFLVILPEPEALPGLYEALGGEVQFPERLGRWAIHAFIEVLEPQTYRLLLEVCEEHPVYLVEQLRLVRTQPPRVRPFIVYCEIRGIVSDHESLEDSLEIMLMYLDSFHSAALLPLAGIYQFQNGKWTRVRKMMA